MDTEYAQCCRLWHGGFDGTAPAAKIEDNEQMGSATRVLQIIRLAMLASIVLYAGICRAIPSTPSTSPLRLPVITILAVMNVVAILIVRRSLISKSGLALAAEPTDGKALAQWRAGYLVTYALSEAIALYGVVLHFLGCPLGQVVPFFLAGLVLIVFFRPRYPSNELG